MYRELKADIKLSHLFMGCGENLNSRYWNKIQKKRYSQPLVTKKRCAYDGK